MPEITIALHERVEAYIKELQTKLEEAEASNASLQVLPAFASRNSLIRRVRTLCSRVHKLPLTAVGNAGKGGHSKQVDGSDQVHGGACLLLPPQDSQLGELICRLQLLARHGWLCYSDDNLWGTRRA